MLLAIHACVTLHHWIMNTKQLSYSADESYGVVFQQYYKK
jgi:hypothetical protein